jgi:hypothetical protein
VTDREWLSCSDPGTMLTYLGTTGRASERKLRLFAVACCERVAHSLVDRRSREAVDVAERFANGLASRQQLTEAYAAAWAALGTEAVTLGAKVSAARAAGRTVQPDAVEAAFYTAHEASWVAANLLEEERESFTQEEERRAQAEEGRCQCGLLRCIFGTPLRPQPRVDPQWRAWNGSTVVRLARAIDDERAFDRMPTLADALEEAGGDDNDLLAHRRQQEVVHARGCWVVDSLLQKE